jgi:hypothetical protein
VSSFRADIFSQSCPGRANSATATLSAALPRTNPMTTLKLRRHVQRLGGPRATAEQGPVTPKSVLRWFRKRIASARRELRLRETRLPSQDGTLTTRAAHGVDNAALDRFVPDCRSLRVGARVLTIPVTALHGYSARRRTG